MSEKPAENPSPTGPGAVLEAMRNFQEQGDLWRLSDALYNLIPHGEKGFDELIDKATAAGVIGKLKKNTLRLYRDTAVRWPTDKRISGVSFSAHREVMPLGAAAGAKMLTDLAKNLGPDKVTVDVVRKTVAIAQNKSTTAAPAAAASTKASAPNGQAAAGPSDLEILGDLRTGGPKLIKAITASTGQLDAIHAGLTKVLTHVDDLRAKANRKTKATAARPTAAKKSTAKRPAAKPPTKPVPKGDLGGL